MAIGLFAVLLYIGLLCVGIAEFMSRIARSKKNKKRSGNEGVVRRVRSPDVSDH